MKIEPRMAMSQSRQSVNKEIAEELAIASRLSAGN